MVNITTTLWCREWLLTSSHPNFCVTFLVSRIKLKFPACLGASVTKVGLVQCISFQESFSLSPLFVLHSTLLTPRKDNQKSGLQLEPWAWKPVTKNCSGGSFTPAPGILRPRVWIILVEALTQIPSPISFQILLHLRKPNDDPDLRDAQDHSHGAFKLPPPPRKQTHGFPVFLAHLLYGGGEAENQECFYSLNLGFF